MKCNKCQFLSKETVIHAGQYPSVRCTLGLWDHDEHEQWYSYGQSQLNRGPVKRLGEACTKGKEK